MTDGSTPGHTPLTGKPSFTPGQLTLNWRNTPVTLVSRLHALNVSLLFVKASLVSIASANTVHKDNPAYVNIGTESAGPVARPLALLLTYRYLSTTADQVFLRIHPLWTAALLLITELRSLLLPQPSSFVFFFFFFFPFFFPLPPLI